MKSSLYIGSLRHRRLTPRPHAFRYRIFMIYLDLAELDTVFRGRWLWSTRRPTLAWLKRSDYFGDAAIPLDTAVRERVAAETGRRPEGPIRMLTHLRYFGLCFNPVTFYYCFDRSGARVETIVAEITNTPWNERHTYVLHADSGTHYRLRKQFHVSPFMGMAIDYDWRFTCPDTALGVHMQNLSGAHKVFDATLALRRQAITGGSLARVLLAFPFATLRVLGGIYWQALRLFLKRVPIQPHPGKAQRPVAEVPPTERMT